MDENFIDILCRDIDIKYLKEKINAIKHNKNNAFIMIDGEWGSGKTTLLKLLKEEIENDNNVIEYNCWENSFYPDPLIAIISSITDQTDKDSDINKLGIKLMRYFKPSISEFSIGGFKIEWARKQKNEEYISLEKYIADFRDKLNNYNKNNVGKDNKKTRIILVDELDRCLPEYAIKVLERLYLLLKDVNDVIVIIASNNEQLEHSIKQIFGETIKIKKYLKKFIDYYYCLYHGSNDVIMIYKKFEKYFTLFDYDETRREKEKIIHLTSYLIDQNNIRDVVQIFENVYLSHINCFGYNRRELYLCVFELLLEFFPIETLNGTVNDMVKNNIDNHEWKGLARLFHDSMSRLTNSNILYKNESDYNFFRGVQLFCKYCCMNPNFFVYDDLIYMFETIFYDNIGKITTEDKIFF